MKKTGVVCTLTSAQSWVLRWPADLQRLTVRSIIRDVMIGDHMIGKTVTLLALSALAAHAQDAWPTKQWPTTTLQAANINRAVVDSIDAEITSGRYGFVD